MTCDKCLDKDCPFWHENDCLCIYEMLAKNREEKEKKEKDT